MGRVKKHGRKLRDVQHQGKNTHSVERGEMCRLFLTTSCRVLFGKAFKMCMHVSFAERGCAGCTFPSALRWALSLAQVDAAVEQSQSSIRSGWPEQLHYYPAFHFLPLVFFSIFVKSSFDDVNIHLWCIFLAPQILISFYLFFLFTLLNQAFVSRFLFQLNFDTKSVQENGMKWVAPASSSCQLGPKAFDLCACSTADCCDSDQRKTRLNSLGMGGKREAMASVTQCHLPRYMQVVLNSVHCKICLNSVRCNFSF